VCKDTLTVTQAATIPVCVLLWCHFVVEIQEVETQAKYSSQVVIWK